MVTIAMPPYSRCTQARLDDAQGNGPVELHRDRLQSSQDHRDAKQIRGHRVQVLGGDYLEQGQCLPEREVRQGIDDADDGLRVDIGVTIAGAEQLSGQHWVQLGQHRRGVRGQIAAPAGPALANLRRQRLEYRGWQVHEQAVQQALVVAVQPVIQAVAVKPALPQLGGVVVIAIFGVGIVLQCPFHQDGVGESAL